ncbi:MAG: NAD-dependent epimerase/dehydratase family protein, partial [Cyanobacteria bacterium J06649_11]
MVWCEKKNMKVAITGATGFVGSRLVKRLQEQGVKIMV